MLAGATAALAYWTVSTVAGSGNFALAQGATLPSGTTPSLGAVSGGNVTINWTAPAGPSLTGYTINRYPTASGGTGIPATGGCAGTINTLTCTEQLLPAGIWYYAVSPHLDSWAGTEGPRLAVTVPKYTPTSLTLSATSPSSGVAETSFTASATIAGGYQPSGAVSFQVYTGSSCTGTQVSGSPVSGTLSGGSATSSGITLGAGTYSWQATYAGDSNNNSSPGSNCVTLTVTRATPIVTWPAPSAITYGTALSTTQLDASASGGVAGTFVYSPAAGSVLGAGAQALSVTFTPTDATDYTTATGSASLTVNQAPLTITSSNGTMTYGGTPPAITASYSGFVNGQTSAVLTTQPTCVTAATATSTVAGSSYTSSCSGAAAANYTIGYVAGSVTVTKAPLTITASSGTMTYGATPPAITASYSGFVNGQTSAVLTTQPTCVTAATATSTVAGSSYTSSCSGAAAANYTIGYVAGSVTVTKAPLTITASSGTMTYGATPPAITTSYSGFVNGQTSAVLTTQPTCVTAATATSTVAGSPYPSSCSGAAAANYTISYVTGLVTVTPALTTTVITSNNNPTNILNESVTYTATVTTTAPGSGHPTGTVTFKDGTSTICTSVTLVGGAGNTSTATCTNNYGLLGLGGSGTHTITATFANTDGNFSGSTGTFTETVQGL